MNFLYEFLYPSSLLANTFNLYSLLEYINGSCIIPNIPSTVATNHDDSDAEFIERSVASNSDCLVWVAVMIAQPFL